MSSEIDLQELDRATANALRGIEPSQSNQAGVRKKDVVLMLERDFNELDEKTQHHLRKKGATLLGTKELGDEVEVICLVESQPWDHEKPMAHGERRFVPRLVAAALKKNRLVEIITDPAAEKAPKPKTKEPV